MSLDAYYTDPDRACELIGEVADLIPEIDLFVEPSAGGGAFLAHLPASTIALDLAPRAPGILEADFLTWEPPTGAERIAVVGNPPFGRNGDQARNFFNHAAKFADVIAFILPASFAKTLTQASLDRRFHLVHERLLPDEPFTKDGEVHRFNVVFQIWEKRSHLRVVSKGKTTHDDFDFVDSLEKADFAVRRVGANAGKVLNVSLDPEKARGLSPSSNYYIRAKGRAAQAVRATFKACDFSESRSLTVTMPSIGKRELIACYDSALYLSQLHNVSPQAGSGGGDEGRELAW